MAKLNLEIDVKDLSPQQVRLIKSINLMLKHVLTTENEEEYFEHSSDLLRFVATAIKKANFSENDQAIEYSRQALEFCVDTLSEQVYSDDLLQYDN